MSKWMFTADWHIQDDSLMDRTIGSKYFNDKMMILYKIVEYCNKYKYEKLFILGDVFNSPSPSIHERQAFHTIMQRTNNGLVKRYILLGNHDYEKNGLDFFHEMSGFKETKQYYDVCYNTEKLDNGNILMQSWKSSSDTVIIQKKCKFWLGHFAVKNFHMSETNICKVGLDCDEGYFKDKYCILGHFHIPAKIGNVRYVGSPYPITFGEGDKEKRVLSYDGDTDKLTSIPIAQITDGPTLGLSTINIRKKKHIKMLRYQIKESGNNFLKGTILRLKYNPCIVKRSKIDRFVSWLNEYNPPYYIDIVPESLSSMNVKSVDKDVNQFTLIKNFKRYMKTNWKNKKLKRKALKVLQKVDSDKIT